MFAIAQHESRSFAFAKLALAASMDLRTAAVNALTPLLPRCSGASALTVFMGKAALLTLEELVLNTEAALPSAAPWWAIDRR
jgi:hypothetical protein